MTNDLCAEFMKLVEDEMITQASLGASSCRIDYDYDKWGWSPLSNAVFILNTSGVYAGARWGTENDISLFISWTPLQ